MPDPEIPSNPQAGVERRSAARHLLQHPLFCKEHNPDVFRLVRRHEAQLDRWFTQRLGYRLHVDADTARLQKITFVPRDRPLRMPAKKGQRTGRPLSNLEHIHLALLMAATVSGPAVISLKDLIESVRSSAAEATISLPDERTERRALVHAIQWMIAAGLATELHGHTEAYITDAEADAVLQMRPDRIALVPLPALDGSNSVEELIERAERRRDLRPWVRARLVEDPVVHRSELTEQEWGELRRRLGDEGRLIEEMFGLVLEARAEGVAAIDPAGTLGDQAFPRTGTIGHAALLLIDELRGRGDGPPDAATRQEVEDIVAELVDRHRSFWSDREIASIDRFTDAVLQLLAVFKLATVSGEGIQLLGAAARFLPVTTTHDAAGTESPALDLGLFG